MSVSRTYTRSGLSSSSAASRRNRERDRVRVSMSPEAGKAGTSAAGRAGAEPSEPTVEAVDTGETYAERWQRREDHAERRRMLETAGVVVDITPAKRRGHWDPDRVSLTIGPPSDAALLAEYAE